jgi:hypothetical protein
MNQLPYILDRSPWDRRRPRLLTSPTSYRRSLRLLTSLLALSAFSFSLLFLPSVGLTQQQSKTAAGKAGSHSAPAHSGMSPALRSLVDQATNAICTEAKLDPFGSMAIDEMQARPSLPVNAPAARSGAERAQRLLPVAKGLVVTALQQLIVEYRLQKVPGIQQKMQAAAARVQAVTTVKPDVDSRDNASVFMSRPHSITFGTIFLAGLRSDEGMISVLAHELTHIADGDNDSLRIVVSAVGDKASGLVGMEIRGQRSEELTCDLIGAMVVRAYVADTPDYQSLSRRLSRSLQHNCVDVDEGDDDHLSPRNTIRALLAVNPVLVNELINER